jgi:hypothetical protein
MVTVDGKVWVGKRPEKEFSFGKDSRPIICYCIDRCVDLDVSLSIF